MTQDSVRAPSGQALVNDAPAGHRPSGFDPSRMSDYEQMLDAQAGCVPCKLCGGRAVITDAGWGAGYYIKCSGDVNFRAYRGCLIDERRAGGWAYNVRDWWNRLHAPCDSDGNPQGGDGTAPSRSDDSAGRDSGIAQPSSGDA